MSKGKNRHPLCLLAAAIWLWPAIACAQTWNPTASDSDSNTAAGTGALDQHTQGGTDNTAIGYHALTATTTGPENTASGAGALAANTTGYQNTASGAYALTANTSGPENTASGAYALFSNSTGGYNTASGFGALTANTSGGYNTANGASALYSNTTGYYNTAVGLGSLFANTTGSSNTVLGYQALKDSTTANNNVAIGAGALNALTSGGNNIALGASAGKATTKGVSNIYIGSLGFPGTENKTIRIGQVQTRTFIAGVTGVPLSGATVVINANGRLGVVASSARYKQDIKSLDDAADRLAQLRPVSYRYKTEPEATHYGLIAEEVDAVMPELVVRDDQNRPESVQYQELIPLLLQQWKAQQAEMARQRDLIAQQRELILQQRERADREEAELAALRRALDTRLAGLGGGGLK